MQEGPEFLTATPADQVLPPPWERPLWCLRLQAVGEEEEEEEEVAVT